MNKIVQNTRFAEVRAHLSAARREIRRLRQTIAMQASEIEHLHGTIEQENRELKETPVCAHASFCFERKIILLSHYIQDEHRRKRLQDIAIACGVISNPGQGDE